MPGTFLAAVHPSFGFNPHPTVRPGDAKVKPEDLTGDVTNGKLVLVRGKL